MFCRAQIFAWDEQFISGGAGIACPDSKYVFIIAQHFAHKYSSRKWITFAWLRGNFKCSTRINKYSRYAFMCTLKGGENPERDSENKSLWHSSPRQRLLAQCLLGFLSGSPDCSEFALWFSFFRKWGTLTENRRSIAFERPIKCGRRAINYFQQSEIAAWVRNLLENVMWKFVESRSKNFFVPNRLEFEGGIESFMTMANEKFPFSLWFHLNLKLRLRVSSASKARIAQMWLICFDQLIGGFFRYARRRSQINFCNSTFVWCLLRNQIRGSKMESSAYFRYRYTCSQEASKRTRLQSKRHVTSDDYDETTIWNIDYYQSQSALLAFVQIPTKQCQ